MNLNIKEKALSFTLMFLFHRKLSLKYYNGFPKYKTFRGRIKQPIKG